jgi:hypothetical protein
MDNFTTKQAEKLMEVDIQLDNMHIVDVPVTPPLDLLHLHFLGSCLPQHLLEAYHWISHRTIHGSLEPEPQAARKGTASTPPN